MSTIQIIESSIFIVMMMMMMDQACEYGDFLDKPFPKSTCSTSSLSHGVSRCRVNEVLDWKEKK